MGRDRAAYMREYRARKRGTTVDEMVMAQDLAVTRTAIESATIRALEEEVRHLKAELAKRPQQMDPRDYRGQPLPGFNTRPFNPVPKRRG